jgi:hypothetical protein
MLFLIKLSIQPCVDSLSCLFKLRGLELHTWSSSGFLEPKVYSARFQYLEISRDFAT